MLLLLRCHRSRWRGKAVVGPRLHLDEAQNIVVPTDQVNLSAVVGRAVIRGDEAIAQPPQVEVCLCFTSSTEFQVRFAVATHSLQRPHNEFAQRHHLTLNCMSK